MTMACTLHPAYDDRCYICRRAHQHDCGDPRCESMFRVEDLESTVERWKPIVEAAIAMREVRRDYRPMSPTEAAVCDAVDDLAMLQMLAGR